MNDNIVKLSSGNVVCAIPECSALLSFKVNIILQHFELSHKSLCTANRFTVSSVLKHLALQLFTFANKILTCTVCRCHVPSTIESLRHHLKRRHDVRNMPDALLQSVLHPNVSSVPLSSPPILEPLQLPTRVLSLHCTDQACDFAVPLSTTETQVAKARLLFHLKQTHKAAHFSSDMTLLQRADSAETGYGVFIGKRCRKERQTSDNASTPSGSPNTVPMSSISTTSSFSPASSLVQLTSSLSSTIESSTISLSPSSSIQATVPSSTQLASSSLPPVSSSALHISLPLSTQASSTDDQCSSQTELSGSLNLDTPIELPSSQQSSSTSSSQLITITPSSSTLRDDFTRQAMLSRYPIFRVEATATAPAPLKITDEAIKCSSSIYQQINWWVTDAWYKEICIEGALEWYNLLQPTPNSSGAASGETLLTLASNLIDVAIHCATVGRMVHPGVAGGLSTTTTHHDSGTDDEMSQTNARYGLSILQPSSRQRYAKELVKVLVYLNNVCIRNHSRALFRADLDNTDVGVGAGYLFLVLFDMEWPKEQHPFHLGTLAQVAAATCLEDSRRPDESTNAPSITDLRLVSAARLASTCSALIYIIKCLIVINHRHTGVKQRTVLFDSSRSGPQLSRVKLQYDNLPETDQSFQKLMIYDFAESTKRQSPVYLYCSSGVVGEGAQQIGLVEISSAVNYATNVCGQTLREMLALLELNLDIADHVVQGDSQLEFDVKNTLGHFKLRCPPSCDHLPTETQFLVTNDLGQYITNVTNLFRQTQDRSQNFKRFTRLFRELQDNLVFLVHVSSGGPGRAQDLFDIALQQTPTSGCAQYLTASSIKLDSIVHKRPDHQAYSRSMIQRFPTYRTCVLLSVYVSVSRGLHGTHDRLWSATVQDESALIQSFNRGASSSFRVSFQFNIWRHMAQLLVAKGDAEIRQLASQLSGTGANSYQTIAEEARHSAGEPSVTNNITRQFGHTTATAIVSYKTRTLTMEQWRLSSRAYQTWLQLPGIDCMERSDADAHDDKRREHLSLLPTYAQYNKDNKDEYVLQLLNRAFQYSPVKREPSKLQLDLVTAAVEGKSDIIVIGGCGSGKSAAYLATGLAAQDQRSCILLLCPQNNVALCAEEMCTQADLNCLRIDDRDETRQCAEDLLSTEGKALGVGVFIATFEDIARCSTFKLLVNALRRFNLLSRVVVDEVHICLSAYSWRMCFNACGHLSSSIGPTIPWIFTTATLPELAMQPYLRFWHLGSRPQSILRSPVEIPKHILIKVEVLREREAFLTKLQGILKSWFTISPSRITTTSLSSSVTKCTSWTAKRVMVLCLSKDEVSQLALYLTTHKLALGLTADDLIAAVTADTNTCETLQAIRNARIIVCTTILSSSMNIPNLNAIVVYKSTYTMADLVQAWGRVGRDGGLSKAVLLWSKVSHNIKFPADAYDAEASTMAWAPSNFRLRNSLRPTFAPSGVLAFAEGKTCRRLQISALFNEAAYSSAKDCQQIFEESNVDYSVVYCDICLMDVTNVQRSLFDNFDDGGDFDDALASALPPASEPFHQSERALAQDEPKDNENEDDEHIEFILRDEGPTPGDEGAQLSTAIFSQLHAIVEEHAQLGSTISPCFMCKSKSCQGIRDDAKATACSNRDIISTYRHNFVCYGCGGHHQGSACKFRAKGAQPPVPTALQRCYTCYLPQQACGAVSFHSGDSNRSGGRQLGDTCKLRGKLIFGLLSAAISCRQRVLDEFMSTHGTHINGVPPQFALAENTDGKLFHIYWSWIWQVSNLREKVLNLDIWLLFLLEKCF